MYTVTLFGLQPIYNSLTVTECRREKWEVTRVVEKEELGKLILFSDLEFMEKVGGGGFGEVWRGRWKSKKRIVAIKKFKELEKREVRQPLYTILESIVLTVALFCSCTAMKVDHLMIAPFYNKKTVSESLCV